MNKYDKELKLVACQIEKEKQEFLMKRHVPLP